MATKDKLVNLEDLKSVYDHGMDLLDEKANQVGEYVDLIAGTADNLLSSSYQTDKTPYIIRRTPFGARQKGTIAGGSVVWNQLVEHGDFDANTEWQWIGATASVSDNTATITPTNAISRARRRFARVQDHVYFAKCMIKGAEGKGEVNMWGGAAFGSTPLNGAWVDVSGIIKAVSGGTYYIDFSVSQNTNMASWQVKDCMLFDLTLMFGPAIADRIYSAEQTSACTGVALAKSLAGITADYIPYDAGSIKSVTGLTAHKMTGFNQWDEEWELGWVDNTGANRTSSGSGQIRSTNYIPVLPNTQYFFKTPIIGVIVYFDADKNCLGNKDANERGDILAPGAVRTTQSNCRYIRFWLTTATTYNNDICINFSDPSKNGTYEPYTAYEYPLDSSLTLRGLPKLDGDSIYYDGDIYPPSGEVERKYYLIDMGVLNWKKSSSGNNYYANLGDGGGLYPKYAIGNAVGMMCARYIVAGARSASPFYGGDKEMTYYYRATAQNPECEIYVHDESYTDVASFKSAMSGVYLLYELAEPTTEQADPFTALQICDPNGTEEWVGANMPVGHDTKYYADLKGKIEDIPDAPSADGTYTLKVTVSGGVATYSWE